MILTGTPMPQAPHLRSQFNFLYPSEHIISDESLIEKFEPLFVRTTKEDLGLMKPIYNVIKVEPYPAFKLFFDEYFVRNLELGSSLEDILSVKSFKKQFCVLSSFCQILLFAKMIFLILILV